MEFVAVLDLFLEKIDKALEAEGVPEFEDEKIEDTIAKLQDLLKKRES